MISSFENMRCSEYRIHNGEENILLYFSPGNLTSTSNKHPTICAAVKSDNNILNFDDSRLLLNGQNVAFKIEGRSITHTPNVPLSCGSYTAKLIIKDLEGNTHDFSWSFIIEEEPCELYFYYGIPHAHTSYSDGAGTPTDAYNQAKSMGLDFLIITDHQGKLARGSINHDNNIKIFGKDSPKWEMLKLEAGFANKNFLNFVALYGFELSTNFWGHINIINSESIIKKKPSNLEELYAWLYDKKDILISVNHPYRSPKTLPFTHNLDNFVNLYEVGNGSTTRIYTRAEEHYYNTLDEGWHIAAINGQDNHIDDWGISQNVTAVVSKDLSMSSIIEAIKLRRVYSTESRSLKLTVKGNNKWMGSILNLKKGDLLELSIQCEDNVNLIEKLQLISKGGKILAEKSFNNSNNCTWNYLIPIKEDYNWYVVKVIHSNGKLAISSAIFTENIII